MPRPAPLAPSLLALFALSFLWPAGDVRAHGSMVHPKSRIYACKQGDAENPSDPACRAAWQVSGSAMFYDWMSINRADADGRHRAVVPDGQLCSGGNPTFAGLDLARADWQAQPIAADANGRFAFLFKGTAPHATRAWTFYITRDGWNPERPLHWSDLEPFCTLGNVPLGSDGNYRLDCPLPKRSGRHVIYNTWQRSDSTEAFYTCMDVRFGAGSSTPPGGEPGTPPTRPGPQWNDAGALGLRGELAVGTVLTLRLFQADGRDAERIEVALGAGQTGAEAWPLRLAERVNAQSRYARVGVLEGGVVTPRAPAEANRVYLGGVARRFALETRTPAPQPGDRYDYAYPDGIGRYRPGETVVLGRDGKRYACRPFPQGGWCNIDHDAYRPGSGYAWQDAWIAY
ncbi:lytic polysaccharide monooxygenase [Lysobacter yananisis]